MLVSYGAAAERRRQLLGAHGPLTLEPTAIARTMGRHVGQSLVCHSRTPADPRDAPGPTISWPVTLAL